MKYIIDCSLREIQRYVFVACISHLASAASQSLAFHQAPCRPSTHSVIPPGRLFRLYFVGKIGRDQHLVPFSTYRSSPFSVVVSCLLDDGVSLVMEGYLFGPLDLRARIHIR